MKNPKTICLLTLILTGTVLGSRAEPYRTDINPALLYYQSFIMGAQLPQADHDYLFTNQWQGQQLPARFGELVSQSDNEFKLVRQAAHATVPCDWGIDWSAGPYTFLPHLARVKATIQMAQLRAIWNLQNGLQAGAGDDLIAAFTLARNGSRDNSLIAVLVQIAGEAIVNSTVAANFGRFSPETLKELMEGFDAAPPRGTMANAIATTESHCFSDWAEARVSELRKEYPGDDAKVLDSFRSIFEDFGDAGQLDTNTWSRIVAATGGTSEGFLKLVREMQPMYTRLDAIAALPQPEFEVQIKLFYADIRKSSNPLIAAIFPDFEKARVKEFASLTDSAMVRAAVEYKLHGEAGLQSVNDPYGHGPFQFQRFVFEGVDRGFELKSAYAGRGFPEAMIFVEKDGPPFHVNGKYAGQAMSP
ncbi:MAG: hypothetical protein ABSC24_00335 [Verrucomicrobiota bacterium]|jgi:hypothetical protein